MAVSGNATTGRPLKRMELVYGNTAVKFAVNPEDYTQKEPNKVTLTHTKGGAWIDAWGAGVTEITIKGITGVRGGTTDIDTGYTRWLAIRDLFRQLYAAVTDGEEIKEYIKLYNYTDGEYWYCYPQQNGLELSRSASKPHLYQYTMSLWGLSRIGETAQPTGVIGNPYKVQSGADSTTQTTTVSTVRGGESKTTADAVTTKADLLTVTNTSTKSTDDILRDCREHALTLGQLIGGNSGKLSPVTAYECTKHIQIQNQGSVSNVTPFTAGGSLIDPFNGNSSNIFGDIATLMDGDGEPELDILREEINFQSRVSTHTYDMYNSIKAYSPRVMSTAYSRIAGQTDEQKVIYAVATSKQYDSTIWGLIAEWEEQHRIVTTEVNHVRVVMLEAMFVYLEIYRMYDSSDLSNNLDAKSMQRFIVNIQSLIMYFMDSQEGTVGLKRELAIQLCHELRRLYTVSCQILADIVNYT